MINMPLSMGGLGEEAALYAGQESMQLILVLVAMLSVPTMLCIKPFLVYRKHKQHKDHLPLTQTEDEDYGPDSHGAGHEEHSLMDIFIHQAIETIEFVLGCVSNTASYLRLWALSLAHAELSEVFWDRVFLYSLKAGGWLLLFGAFAVWT